MYLKGQTIRYRGGGGRSFKTETYYHDWVSGKTNILSSTKDKTYLSLWFCESTCDAKMKKKHNLK